MHYSRKAGARAGMKWKTGCAPSRNCANNRGLATLSRSQRKNFSNSKPQRDGGRRAFGAVHLAGALLIFPRGYAGLEAYAELDIRRQDAIAPPPNACAHPSQSVGFMVCGVFK